ncbi:MAG TPA: aldehyde dehydrogenase family protein [Candidatus Elarobacter sp.]|nr:aldehyde dehydrogenase family protein [Candidatus Elarobacter sp.]
MEVGAGPLPAAALDADVAALRARADAWARLSLAGKIRHLRAMRARTIEVAQDWVDASARAKGIAGTSLAGEEWLSGPYPWLTALDRMTATLGGIARDGVPPIPERAIRTRPPSTGSGQAGHVIVEVFPLDRADTILLSGVSAEIWMQPEVTRETLFDNVASFYKQHEPRGSVTLVLGAGNVASIPPLDVLYALYAHGSVVMLKLNPVNGYLEPLFARIFSSLIDEGYVRITDGGADAGAYLCEQPGIDAIHLTGGERTHDAIVFGGGAEGEARKRAGTPAIAKPVTSELGNVTPVIVVPGPWSEADLAFQAAHVATQKLHNAGANCIAAQVLVTPASWSLTPRFLDCVRKALGEAPQRPSYYPGTGARMRSAEYAHPSAERVNVPVDGVHRLFVGGLDPASGDEPLFHDEAFGPLLAQTSLPGDGAAGFLRNAVAFCNERLRGTLGCSILIHPRTIRKLGAAFEDALAELRYGCIAINGWPGVGYSLATASWGAFPGGTLSDVGSGIGVVHNAYLFDKPQKTVMRAPFAPFPRSFGDGERTLLPTPPWFVTHRHADAAGRNLFAYTAEPSMLRMAAVVFDAMRA